MARVLVIVPFPLGESGIGNRAAQLEKVELGPGIEFDFRGVRAGPALLDSGHDTGLAEVALAEVGIRAQEEGYDAVCIDTMSDSGVGILRSFLDIPVIGPGRASYLTALMLGDTFSVLTQWDGWIPIYKKGVRDLGLESHLASIRSINMLPDVDNLLGGKEERRLPDAARRGHGLHRGGRRAGDLHGLDDDAPGRAVPAGRAAGADRQSGPAQLQARRARARARPDAVEEGVSVPERAEAGDAGGDDGGGGGERAGGGRGLTLPLADIRVVAVEQFGAGPWATLQLADLGAEVIKIEDPRAGGDVGRYVPPFQEGEDSLFFETFNRNKTSVSLDLRHPDARPVLEDLVRASDAVYSNLRGDQPARLGLTYEQLKDVNPRIVCCSLSGFGMTGPRAAEGGYDFMMQGLAGWQLLTGDPDGPPTKSGISLVDLSGGYASTIALLAGLWRARRDGVGCDCDVSLFETALHELMYIGPWAATHGYVPPRRRNSAHASIVPFQNFRAADGWIVVAAAKQSFWERLCEVIGEPGLADDPRFATMAARDEHRDELVPILEARVRDAARCKNGSTCSCRRECRRRR